MDLERHAGKWIRKKIILGWSNPLTTTQQHPRIAAVWHRQAPLISWLVNVSQSSEISVFNLYWNQVWASVRLRTVSVILSCCISWTPAWGPICASHTLLPEGTSFGHDTVHTSAWLPTVPASTSIAMVIGEALLLPLQMGWLMQIMLEVCYTTRASQDVTNCFVFEVSFHV